MTIHTPDWVRDAVFYQIFPDRFASSPAVEKPANLEPWESSPTARGFKGGDLLGVKEHLDYLEALGITAIYFNPIFQSAANHRYHTYDYYQIDPLLGGNAAFRELLDAAHSRGIHVMLDGVFNHASRGFFQFNHIMENGPSSPYLEWFQVQGFPLRAFHGRPNYAAWWNNPELPKLNTESAAVRDFLYDVAEHWLHQGIDGWRLDVPLEIETPGFWEEFRKRVKAINPEAYILAEIWHEAEAWLEGEHFDAVMNYPFNRACQGFFGGSKLDTSVEPGGFPLYPLKASDFAEQIELELVRYPQEVIEVQYNLLSSHDESRFLTLMQGDKARLRLATLYQMCYPGTPSIYYGDEIGLEGGEDPDCRRAFPWDERRWDQELLADFRRYIALRHEHPALRRGRYVTLYAEGQVYAFSRQSKEEALLIVLNAGEESVHVTLPLTSLEVASAAWVDVWSDERWDVSEEKLKLELPGLQARVLRAL